MQMWGVIIMSISFLLIYAELSLGMRFGTTLVSGLLQPIVVGFMLGIAAGVLVPLADGPVSIVVILGTLAILSVVLAIVLKVFGVRELAIVKGMLVKVLPKQVERLST